MKKFFTLCAFVFLTCGFESISEQIHSFDVENKSPSAWEVETQNAQIKAYNATYDLELTLYVNSFMPNSPQCLSNKRIKDIKFEIDFYKKVQKGDTNWAKMVERVRLNFTGSGISEEKKVYGSNLLKNNAPAKIGSVVHIGSLLFLSPLTCEKVDNMRLKLTGIVIRGRVLPPLELQFTLTK
ncbi:MAG: hypothetical protein IJ870_05410 [Alphaproteobacteria bacterium]|nr:hypothetical protein [Alphaproteobacteria bacterium]